MGENRGAHFKIKRGYADCHEIVIRKTRESFLKSTFVLARRESSLRERKLECTSRPLIFA
jgi:hypothetical protein